MFLDINNKKNMAFGLSFRLLGLPTPRSEPRGSEEGSNPVIRDPKTSFRGHRDLRASLSPFHDSSDRGKLGRLSRAGIENRKEASHGGHGVHGGCLESRSAGLLAPALDPLSPDREDDQPE